MTLVSESERGLVVRHDGLRIRGELRAAWGFLLFERERLGSERRIAIRNAYIVAL